jgi:hypothetical protein
MSWQKQVGSRPVSHMTITLSLAPDALEQSDVLGYQPPLPLNLVTPAHAQHMGGRKDTRDHDSALREEGKQRSRGGKGGGRVRGRAGSGKAKDASAE